MNNAFIPFTKVLGGVKVSEVTKDFADRLGQLISDSGKKVKKLADDIGVSSGALSKYQNDGAVAGIDALAKIAKYFGVSADWLLGIVNDPVFDADERAISEATGLSGLSVAILTQSKSSPKLANILSILIEEEFSFAYLYGDALKKHPNVLSKNMKDILNGIEEEVDEAMRDLDEGEKDDEYTKNCLREYIEQERIIRFASNHYKPILSCLYNYLLGWKKAWTDSESKNLYITENGEITEDRGKGVQFQQDEVVEYAFLLRIQDNIRALKVRRAKEAGEKIN